MRHILHADFDAFYASVEQRDNLDLRGMPLVVGGSPEGRGVVASASYEARRYGIHSAMPMRTAYQRCPKLLRAPPRFERYSEVSRAVMSIFRDITPLVEPLSMDEAYLDVTDSVDTERPVEVIAAELKKKVRTDLGLTISVGVATSKSVAKVASDMDKPDGLTVVPPGTERDFLAPLTVDKLWGVGPKTAARLAMEDVHMIGQLAQQTDAWLASRFGRVGEHMRRLSRGEDTQPVEVRRQRKSVSAETTLAQDSGDPEALIELVSRLSLRVGNHLSSRDLHARTVKLKLRLADFTTFTRQKTLADGVESSESVDAAARALLRAELAPGRLFRLVGVGVTGFDEVRDDPVQPRLAGFE